jgi:hypothetical protein
MEFDLPALAAFLTKTGLMQKRFSEMNKLEIIHFCEQVHCATTENTGWLPPYLNSRQELVIPAEAPPIFRYWNGGQPLKQTLIEMEVSNEIMERYCPAKTGGKTRFEKGKQD